MKRSVLLLVLACCGGPTKANPCATKGASYLQHSVERSGGSCGQLSDTVTNITADGTVAGSASLNCDSIEQSGCTAHDTGCKTTTNGITCSTTTSVTFAADGAGASGDITISCSGTASCVSTYDVTLTRQ